jgi:hypothetical protein
MRSPEFQRRLTPNGKRQFERAKFKLRSAGLPTRTEVRLMTNVEAGADDALHRRLSSSGGARLCSPYQLLQWSPPWACSPGGSIAMTNINLAGTALWVVTFVLLAWTGLVWRVGA